MIKIGAFLATAIAVLATAFWIIQPPAPAPHYVLLDEGGIISSRYMEWAKIRNDNRQVVVDGLCFSACTMLTGLVPKENVCVTPRAVLGVHSAMFVHNMQFALYGTQVLWFSYSPEFREMVSRRNWHGNTEHKDLLMFKYDELRHLYRDCTTSEVRRAASQIKNG